MSASSRTERHSKQKLQPLACAARGPSISKQIYDQSRGLPSLRQNTIARHRVSSPPRKALTCFSFRRLIPGSSEEIEARFSRFDRRVALDFGRPRGIVGVGVGRNCQAAFGRRTPRPCLQQAS
jgi:hypothetical protein